MDCNPMDYMGVLPGELQPRILEWVDFPFSRGSSQPRDWTQVSCTAGRFFISWATMEAQNAGVGRLSLLQQIFPTQESRSSQPWIFTGRTVAEAPITGQLMRRADSSQKALRLGKTGGRRRRGRQRMRWLDGITNSINMLFFQSFSLVWLFETSWIVAHQASLSFTIS